MFDKDIQIIIQNMSIPDSPQQTIPTTNEMLDKNIQIIIQNMSHQTIPTAATIKLEQLKIAIDAREARMTPVRAIISNMINHFATSCDKFVLDRSQYREAEVVASIMEGIDEIKKLSIDFKEESWLTAFGNGNLFTSWNIECCIDENNFMMEAEEHMIQAVAHLRSSRYVQYRCGYSFYIPDQFRRHLICEYINYAYKEMGYLAYISNSNIHITM